MKIQLFLIGLVTLGVVSAGNIEEYGEPKLEGIIDGLINTTINNILANLTDPIAISNLSLSFDQDLLSGSTNISKFQLYGIKKLVATNISVSVLSLAMNATIEVPQILLNTKYYADIVAAQLVPLYGDGSISATIDDIVIQVGGKVNMTGGLSLSNVTVAFTLGDATFSLTGLLNNPDLSSLISQVLNDNVVSFINDNVEVLSKIISPIAQQLINVILNGGSSSALEEELRAYHYDSQQKLS
ncbi:uncharacterized protein LOC126744225 [Anthonomus grandis grandis]|uniref:uncharacterized protein LOC126744225 n=1 Tax=Anthonomus grandis grandis TaxID=2921223 RepID=UPI00216628FE|nr:uncharacterized protein LOC126744225 [Anthonomus grandis grandis]